MIQRVGGRIDEAPAIGDRCPAPGLEQRAKAGWSIFGDPQGPFRTDCRRMRKKFARDLRLLFIQARKQRSLALLARQRVPARGELLDLPPRLWATSSTTPTPPPTTRARSIWLLRRPQMTDQHTHHHHHHRRR